MSPNLHAMVTFNLQGLKAGIDAALKSGKLDFASKAHLTACGSRIARMLEPELDEYDRRGS